MSWDTVAAWVARMERHKAAEQRQQNFTVQKERAVVQEVPLDSRGYFMASKQEKKRLRAVHGSQKLDKWR